MAGNPWMQTEREISIAVSMYVNHLDGTTGHIDLGPADIVSYTIDESSGISGFTLGTTVAASYTMELDNSADQYVPSDFYRARVEGKIGIKTVHTYDPEEYINLVGLVASRVGQGYQIIESSHYVSLAVQCSANSTYTIKKTLGGVYSAGYTTEYPAAGVTLYGYQTAPGYSGTGVFTLQTGSNAQYLFIRYYADTIDTLTPAEILESITIIDESSVQMEYTPFGVWFVDDVIAPEQSAIITIRGMDALGTKLDQVREWEETGAGYITTIRDIIDRATRQCGVSVKSTTARPNIFPNDTTEWDNTLASPLAPQNIGTVTCRELVSVAAANAAGFARMTRDGQLYIQSYLADSKTYYLAPSVYLDLTLTGVEPFLFNCLEADYWVYDVATIEDGPPEVWHTTATIDSRIAPDASNTIQMQAPNIKFKMDLENIASFLRGLSSESGSVSYIGDPRGLVGDTYYITDLDGRMHKLISTGQTVKYDGGLTMSISCQLPSANTQNSGSYNVTRPFINNYGQIITQYDISGEDTLDISGGTPTQITTQPSDATVSAGSDAVFAFVATPVPSSVQWLYRTGTNNPWTDIEDSDLEWSWAQPDDFTGISVTATADITGYQFMAHIQEETGYNTDAFTDAATLTVT